MYRVYKNEFFIFISESDFSSLSLLFYRTSSKVLLYTVRDTCNDFLVQYFTNFNVQNESVVL